MPLSPDDMAPEGDPERAGWPLTHAELSEWYPAAARVLGLPDLRFFEPVTHAEHLSRVERALFDTGQVTPTVSLWARGPMRFGAAQRTTLRRSARIRLLLHGNALRLRPAADRRSVAALEVAVLHGPTFEIRARRYVVACGGVENARLLLLSNLGNEHDLVGRYSMDHPRAVFGRVRLAPVHDSPTSAAVPWPMGSCSSGSASRPGSAGLKGCSTTTPPWNPSSPDTRRRAISRWSRRRRSCCGRATPGAAGRWGAHRLSDIPGMIYLLTPKELMPHPLYRLYWNARSALHPRPDGRARVIVYFCEQPPDRESRVLLGAAQDALGQPRVELRWRIGPEVTRSVLALQERLATTLSAAGIGELERGEGEPRYTDASHHMGTTRMSRDPRTGVADPDCRVHGLDNLYLAGSSVFPTAGHANPTPTIIALALRLADHLRRS